MPLKRKDTANANLSPSNNQQPNSKGPEKDVRSPSAKTTGKSPKAETGGYDPFVRDSLFPDPQAIFAFSPAPLTTIKDQAVFVLDANVLLLPYTTGRIALQEIKKVYKKLADENRLIVPYQAAREFAVHRLDKISQLYSQAQQSRESLPNVKMYSSPSLELLAEFDQYLRARSEADRKIGECRELLGKIEGNLLEWYHADPVLAIYRELFVGDVLCGSAKTAEQLKSDSERRNLHKIPPGSCKEDSTKPDGGIGDKIIWHTLLESATKLSRHAVLVTQDITKGDWVHYHGQKNSERVLFPRYELTEEFRIVSKGKTLHVIELATLLKLFGAEQAAIESIEEAVQTEEQARGQGEATNDQVLRLLRRCLANGPRSFRLLREADGVALTGNQFLSLIKRHPGEFKRVLIPHTLPDGKKVHRAGIALNRRPVKML